MRVLALDLATSTGWAVADSDAIIASGAMRLSGKGAAEANTRHARLFDAAATAIADLITAWRPAVLCPEQPNPNGLGDQVLVGCGLRAIALVAGYRRELLLDPVSISTWQAWARKRHGWSKADKGDQADAEFIARWWQAVRADRVREGGA